MPKVSADTTAPHSVATAVATQDINAFFAALRGVADTTSHVSLAALPEALRVIRVLSAYQMAIEFYHFTLGFDDEGEDVIAWSRDGAGRYAADASRFCDDIGADALARYLDRLIALYPGRKLPGSLENMRNSAERIKRSATDRVHKSQPNVLSNLAAPLRRWLKKNQREIEQQLEEVQSIKDDIRSFAREVARAYDGKLKRDELALWDDVNCDFVVAGSYRGRPLSFWIFRDGCFVQGATTRKPAYGYFWNRPVVDQGWRMKGVLPTRAMPVFHARYFGPGKERILRVLREDVRAFWTDDRSRKALLELGLKPNESLALFPDDGHGGRPHFHFAHHSRDLTDLNRRLDILIRLFPPVPEGADVVRQVSEQAYGIKLGARKHGDASPHRFGGSPEGLPKCPNCRTPIHLILTIDTGDKTLRLPKLGRRSLPVIYCLNCMSWDPLYVDYSTDLLRVVHQAKEQKANDDPLLDERPVSLVPLASPNTSASKVGGSPKWLQGPRIPECVRCAKPMTFFAQFKSLPDLAFGDEGMLYSFLCPSCNVSATFIQSH